MAYSLRKKVAIRVQRLIDDLAKLRTEHPNTHAEMADLNACITEAQRMADRWRDMFATMPAARPAPAPRPASTAPAPYAGPPVVAPVYGPTTGITEAKPKASQHWTVKAVAQDREDDEAGLTFLPANSTPEEYVQQCLDNQRAPTLCEAAQMLAAAGGEWLLMTAEQRVAAIEAKALEIEEEDAASYGQAPAAAPAAVVDDAEGVRF